MSGEVLRKCFDHIVREVRENPGMSEDELYSVLDRSGFFECLGYERFGVEVRKQFVIVGGRKKADYVCLDEYQNVIFVIEAKKPREKKLEDALDQLWERYVLPLKARYGVLTNGRRFIVYRRVIGRGYDKVVDVELEKVSKVDCKRIFSLLRRPEYEITYLPRVREYFESVETLSLKEPLAKEYFFETFKLNVNSIFGALVRNLVKLFDRIYPQSKFLKGAYGFWHRSLARKPERIPDSWKPFLKEDRDVFKFMFCLETAHALLARLILAKACEDLDFPGINVSRFTLEKVHQVRDQIPVLGYPIVLIRLLREMRDQLIYSIFEEDIFSWWTDAFVEFGESSSVELLHEKVDNVLEGFSRAIARLIFVLYKFDFSEVAGDPLGDLYQQYFDRETRKALGEFYTPVEVVNYILDAVKYKNVRYKRLLDPACGSGTFLVEALKRYLKEAKPIAKRYGWTYVLRELCNNPKIVGLDIHPFACLIAQVRFMLELIPYYKKALEEEKLTVYEALQRLPIFRTDSLVIEIYPQEFRKTPSLFVTEEDLSFIAPLPVRKNGEEYVSARVVIPSWKKTAHNTNYMLFNLDEYFCVIQAVFDVVKSMLKVGGEKIPIKGFEAHLKKYLANKDFTILANFFRPYANKILDEIRRLQLEFEDGRLVKSIEDVVLACLLKNYLQYDYVVGNPPYVRVQELIKEKKEIYKKIYRAARGNYDIYVVFIERGLNWLKDEGKLGFICSNRFATVNYGKELRRLISNRYTLLQFVDFGDTGVFRDVLNYPAIIIFKNKQAKQDTIIKVCKVIKRPENVPESIFLEEIKTKIASVVKETDFIEEENFEAFGQAHNTLNQEGWYFMPHTRRKLFEKLTSALPPLLKFAISSKKGSALFEGTSTGAKDIFVVKKVRDVNEQTMEILCPREGKRYKIEKSILRPYIEDAGKWLPPSTIFYLIFPYKKLKGKHVFIPEERMKLEYPLAYSYLLSHKEKLLKRKGYSDRRDWYSYSAPRSLDLYGKEKLLIQGFSVDSSVSLDRKEGVFFGPDIYGLRLKQAFKDYSLLILGILNSKITNFFARLVGVVHGSGYYKFEDRFIKKLPIKLPQTSKEKKVANAIVKEIERILICVDPQRIIGGFPEAYLRKYYTFDKEFDEITYTFNADHSRIEPIVTGQPEKGYVVYPSENEDPIWLDTKEKAEYVSLALKRKKSVCKNDVAKIIIPKDNKIVKEILETFKRRLDEIGKISIEKLERKIDELVFQLYGLEDQDTAVIKDFLKKF